MGETMSVAKQNLKAALFLAQKNADYVKQIADLEAEIRYLRTEREREPGSDMLKALHACSVSAYGEVKAERDELLNMLEDVTWQAAGMGDRVSSWSISTYEDAIEMLKEYKRLVPGPIEQQYIRAVKS